MLKRLFAFLLCLSMLVGLFMFVACTPSENQPKESSTVSTEPQTTQPEEIIEADVPGYQYKVTDAGAIITGYTGSDVNLVIPTYAGGVRVVGIESMAFTNNHTISSVTLSKYITDTGVMAFFGCDALVKVTVAEGVTSIARGCFNMCTSLSEVILPSTLQLIGVTSFQGTSSLKQITFSENLKEIGYRAFANSGLVTVTLPASVTDLAGGVFANCRSLTSCTILGNIPNVPQDMFRECLALESVSLPMSINSVGTYAFYRCISLKELDLGNVDYLNNFSLWGCTSLEKVYFHTTKFDRICQRVFAFVPKLKDIYYAGTLESWTGMRRIDDWNESLPEITIHADYQF